MRILVYSKSRAYERHLKRVLPGLRNFEFAHTAKRLTSLARSGDALVLVHSSLSTSDIAVVLESVSARAGIVIAVAADHPRLEEMLALSSFGIHAYFNSYMADIHYAQALRLLEAGQTWFAPELLVRALRLAGRGAREITDDDCLERLTPRERDIALDVAHGFSNKRIATGRNISETTVKTHLTRIFKKLHTRDRLGLAVKLSGYG